MPRASGSFLLTPMSGWGPTSSGGLWHWPREKGGIISLPADAGVAELLGKNIYELLDPGLRPRANTLETERPELPALPGRQRLSTVAAVSLRSHRHSPALGHGTPGRLQAGKAGKTGGLPVRRGAGWGVGAAPLARRFERYRQRPHEEFFRRLRLPSEERRALRLGRLRLRCAAIPGLAVCRRNAARSSRLVRLHRSRPSRQRLARRARFAGIRPHSPPRGYDFLLHHAAVGNRHPLAPGRRLEGYFLSPRRASQRCGVAPVFSNAACQVRLANWLVFSRQ